MTTQLMTELAVDKSRLCVKCEFRIGRKANRGLCNRCYKSRPGAGTFRRRLPEREYCSIADRPLDPNPTDARPGTLEKVLMMERRKKLGYNIFHPDDANW